MQGRGSQAGAWEPAHFTKDCRKRFSQGDILGARQDGFPWDFTISIIDLNGKIIDHDNYPAMVGTRRAKDMPWRKILSKRYGEFLWPDSYKSYRLTKILTELCGIKRFTKFNFKEIKVANVILLSLIHI